MESWKVGGLVHFSADTLEITASMSPENMVLTSSASMLET
jgi:hypothetical protein